LKVLIVDPSKSVRRLHDHICRKVLGNYTTIFFAEDGEAALEMFKIIKPHLIISDIVLPKLSGNDLVRGVREYDNNMAIIIVTDDLNRVTNIVMIDDVVEKGDPRIVIDSVKYVMGKEIADEQASAY